MLATSADEARRTTAEYIKHNTAYGKPLEVSEVEPHDHPEPHVVHYEWGGPHDWPQTYDDHIPEPPEQGLPPSVGPRRFTAPDGQVFFGEREGRLFVFWPEQDDGDRREAYWDENDRHYALIALASTLGFRIAREAFPSWLEELESQVTPDLAGYDCSP